MDAKQKFQCGRCEGKGSRYNWDKTHLNPCDECDGSGIVTIDVAAIVKAITCSRGKRKGMLKKSLSSYDDSLPFGAYYVWRMARFHGGADLCMPVMATLTVSRGPACEYLDKLSDIVARKAFGSDMVAAELWSGLLG